MAHGVTTKTITCVGCGKQSLISASRGVIGKRKYCSANCYREHPPLSSPCRQRGVTIPCEICGTPVYRKTSQANRSKNLFCCQGHADLFQKRNLVSIVCKTCGIDFQVSKSFAAEGRLYCSMKCRNSDPEFLDRLAKHNIAQQKGKTTKPEKIGYAILDSLDVSYLKQYTLFDKFCVDAFIPSLCCVVQFDGDYWHGHPDKFPEPNRIQIRNMQRDVSQDAYFEKCGYSVIRVWEHDLLKNRAAVVERLQSCLS